jgi:glycolate oxidase iron-sulfur subunit
MVMAKEGKRSSALDEVIKELYLCNKCGFCQTACKVYKTDLNESFSARGRVQLIKGVAEGRLPVDEGFRDAVNSCLLCQECAVACPSGVKPHELVVAARRYMQQTEGLPLDKKIILGTLADPFRRKLAFSTARFLRNNVSNRIEGFNELKGIDVRGMPIDKIGFIDQVPELNKAPASQGRVGFFVGCFINHSLAKTGHAIVKVLNKNAIDVVVPKKQLCCGTPQNAYGDFELAKKNARKNIRLFKDLDAVITGCGSCGAMLKKEYLHLFADEPDFLPEVEAFAQKIFDFSAYVLHEIKLDPDKFKVFNHKVTYHDGCHLARGLKITKEPRKVLKSIPRIEYVELREADRCCGAAGLFQSYFYEIAKDISRQKVQNIENTGADIVVTGCPACVHRIQGSLRLAGKEQKVVHLADLLADAHQ